MSHFSLNKHTSIIADIHVQWTLSKPKNKNTVNSRYLEVVGTIFYKFKLPEVQINLHFGVFGLVKKSQTPTYGLRKQSKCFFDSDRRFEFRRIRDIRVRDIEIRLYLFAVFVCWTRITLQQIKCQIACYSTSRQVWPTEPFYILKSSTFEFWACSYLCFCALSRTGTDLRVLEYRKKIKGAETTGLVLTELVLGTRFLIAFDWFDLVQIKTTRMLRKM